MADPDKAFLQKLLVTFQGEAHEHLHEIVSTIVLLEQAGENEQEDFVKHVLKKLHTLKGAARAVNLADLEMLCHTMESVFSAMGRTGQTLAPAQFDLLHQAGIQAQNLLREPSGRVRNQARALIAQLELLSKNIGNAGPAGQPAQVSQPADAEVTIASLQPASIDPAEPAFLASDAPQAASPNVIRVQSRLLDAIRYQAEALLSVELSLQHQINDLLALADDMANQSQPAQLSAHQPGRPGLGAAAFAGKTRAPSVTRPENSGMGSAAQDNRQIVQRCQRLAEELSRTRRNFMIMRSNLLEATLEAGLVPFSSVLEPLPGLVRNLARSQGKEAVLRVEGESVQIDRRVLEVIREALIHLVTNAVDHGLEPADVRQAQGKPAHGVVQVNVTQHGGSQVSVTVADDGAGIDVAAVIASAARLRDLPEAHMATLSDQQKLQLALRSGVSTSRVVTPVSGRGVGLAIVADKVASVGGELLIENAAGAGCLFRLVLPVRLATLRGLIVRSRGAVYVLPLSGIDSVRALRENDVQTVENRETLHHEKRVIPVLRLGHLFDRNRIGAAAGTDENLALIVRNAGNSFAILVDEILAEQEVLPKSLGKQLRRVRFFTGATQLGDGTLVPILGLEDIAKYGLASSEASAPATRSPADAAKVQRILVAEDSITSRLLLKHILESAGFQVETAVDGLDALSKLRHEDFDVLVSDIEMPRLDGLALTGQVRANPKTAEMPVVLVTSLQSAEEKERGLQAGADAYVVKGSFDQDNLLATVRRLI